MILPRPKTVFEQFFGDPSATTDLESPLPGGVPSRCGRRGTVRQLAHEPVLLWMPYEVRVR